MVWLFSIFFQGNVMEKLWKFRQLLIALLLDIYILDASTDQLILCIEKWIAEAPSLIRNIKESSLMNGFLP